jgi:ABC-2 type transport system ATP-binding protein
VSLIETHGLSKHYGKVRALDGLDLTLAAGEPIALVGPNGAGKTTLLSLLCGFITASGGSATVLGHPVGSRQLVGRVSALPQDANFDPRISIGRQMRLLARLQGMSSSAAAEEVQRVLDTVQLGDIGSKKPDELSHGMRKRMSLAQALIGSPELVMLDEPTAGIDPPNVKIIRDLIRRESDKATFIISSHNLDELEKLCGSVVYLASGKLVEHGPIDPSADSGYLTLRPADIDDAAFIEACQTLPGVSSVQQQAQGDFLIRYDKQHTVDQQLLQLLAANGWSYRYLINGRSLEDRLYGQ